MAIFLVCLVPTFVVRDRKFLEFWNFTRTLTCLVFYLLTAEDSVSNSYELSAEMDSIGSDRRRFSPRRDLASTYFDQRIPIPQDEGVSLLLKSNLLPPLANLGRETSESTGR